MKSEESASSLDRYLAETLKASPKSTEELLAEHSEKFDEAEVISFPIENNKNWARPVIGLALLAACVILGLFFVPKLMHKPGIVNIVATTIVLDQKAYRSADDPDRLRNFIEGRQPELEALYLRETKHLPQRMTWKAEYEVRMVNDVVEVQVVVSSVDEQDYLFRLRRQYATIDAFKDALITLENELIAILLDDTRNLEVK